MACERVGNAIVCGRTRKGKRFTRLCECMAPAAFQCDWITDREGPLTCDAYVCARHATQVGPDKHLCPTHAEAWSWHPANKRSAA
jgi:hypothetical protein